VKSRIRLENQIFWLIPIFLLATTHILAAETNISASDIPSKGRSAFDHLIDAPKTKLGYEIPYPFEKLIAKIRSKLEDKQKLSVLFVPFGRSIQKFAADPNYFRYPRTILAVTGKSKPQNVAKIPIDFRSKLYIGYVEVTNTLEVISYNEILGRFEFQVVENYGKNRKPVAKYIARKICLTCHESSVPIFPGEPWSETNENNLIAENIIRARGGRKQYFGINITLEDQPARGFSREGETFDSMISNSTQFIYNQSRRNLLCPEKSANRIECMGNSLLVSFANLYNVWKGPSWKALVDYKQNIESFYQFKTEIDIPFPFISDRDPLTNKPVNFLTDLQTKLPTKNMDHVKAIMKSNISHLRNFSDPKKSRKIVKAPLRKACKLPKTDKPWPHLKWCETRYFFEILNLRQRRELKKRFTANGEFDFSQIERALIAMTKNAQKNPALSLAQKHISRQQFYDEFMSTLDNNKPRVPAFLDPLHHSPMPGDLNSTNRKKGEITDPDLMRLSKYCGECHSHSGLSYPIQFLRSLTVKQMQQELKKNKKSITECLKNKETSMPPVKSEEHRSLLLNANDRNLMIKYIEAI